MGLNPGALMTLGSEWTALLWQQLDGSSAADKRPRSPRVHGPAFMLVIARVADPAEPEMDDVFVIGPRGISGWTYVDSASQGRLKEVVSP